MVCVACFVMPICLWVWFTFIMPLIVRLKSALFPGSIKQVEQEKTESNNDEVKKHPDISKADAGMKCPFASKNAEAKKVE